MAITGTIVNPGDYVDVSYSGGIQQYEIPYTGVYKLEVKGGQGGYSGGNGGHSVGYKKLNKGTLLYICCGGAGNSATNGATSNGGYNGGGKAHSVAPDPDGDFQNVGSGGGATHIALVTGTLASIGKNEFITNSKGLIVAGGGGGGNQGYACGGAGGGTTGGNGASNYSGYKTGGIGGTQSNGGTGHFTNGDFGIGGEGYTGGGSGYYGGGGSNGSYGQSSQRNKYYGGGGGSGYIGGVPAFVFKGVTYSPSMQNGVNSGNGNAKITLMDKAFPTLFLGDNAISSAYLGDTDVSNILIGDNPLA